MVPCENGMLDDGVKEIIATFPFLKATFVSEVEIVASVIDP